MEQIKPIAQCTKRRKTAAVHARLYKGTGKIKINKQTLEQYFRVPNLIDKLTQILRLTGEEKNYDIELRAKGGGISGQLRAAIDAIGQSLRKDKPEHTPIIKQHKSEKGSQHQVERKKPGKKKARKKPTWVKR